MRSSHSATPSSACCSARRSDLVYAFLTLPLARLADLWVRRNIVAASLFLWSLFTAATFFAKSFAFLFVTRMGVGIGEAGGTAPNVSLLSDLPATPNTVRAACLSSRDRRKTLGMGVGMVIGGNVAETQGWAGGVLVRGHPPACFSQRSTWRPFASRNAAPAKRRTTSSSVRRLREVMSVPHREPDLPRHLARERLLPIRCDGSQPVGARVHHPHLRHGGPPMRGSGTF